MGLMNVRFKKNRLPLAQDAEKEPRRGAPQAAGGRSSTMLTSVGGP